MDTARKLPDSEAVRPGATGGVAEQIQSFAQGRQSGVLHIFHNDATGKIFLLNGEVVDAVFGGRRGVKAAIEMINLPNPPTAFTLDEGTRFRTIQMSYVELLLNAARYQGEGDHGGKEKDEKSSRRPLLGLKFWLHGDAHLYRIERDAILIGRSNENDLIILEPSISRTHARIERYDFGVMLHDLDSANGTFLAGHRIKDAILQSGDDIWIGQVPARFLVDEFVEVTPRRPSARPSLARPNEATELEQVGRSETAPLPEDVAFDVHFPIIPAARPIRRVG